MLLFDLGFGNVRQLVRAGLDPSRITDVFVSHRHPDHVGDLPALLFLLHSDVRPRAGLLRLWGPAGFPIFVRRLRKAWDPWLSPKGFRLEVRELRGRAARDGWTAEALRVPHPTPAQAARLAYKGKTFVYSGDTGFAPELAEFAADADLFALECTLAERAYEANGGHLCARVAIETLLASACRQGLLVHLAPESEREARQIIAKLPRLPAAPRRARGPRLLIARDLMRIQMR